MKLLTVIFPFSIAMVLATMFFACSSTDTKNTTEDEFFEPVDKIAHKKPGTSSIAHESVSEEIVVMLQEQNRQLNNVVRELNSLTKRESADTLKSIKYLSGSQMIQDKASNEMLLEMIREQNLRLNDVVEQLKLLSQYQQSNQNRSYTNATGTPIEPSSVSFLSSPQLYEVSLGYGKAIQLYQQRKYRSAIHAFQSLLDNGVHTDLKDNCHFWMGVCYFNLNRIDQAMDEFTGVLNIAGSDKREGAYFMMGQCYEQRGANNDAKAAFEKMMRKYPTGSLKQIAEIKLALLK
ncbi:MAG: tetratricopeptide repeat protein [Bacteroidota bacterium]